MKNISKVNHQLPDEYSALQLKSAQLQEWETSLKQVEERLHQVEELNQALFERSTDCIYIHDFEGNFIDANAAALSLLGYEKQDLSSLNFIALIDRDQVPRVLKAMEEIKETGSKKKLGEYRLKCKDGKYVFVETKGFLVYRDGKPYAIQGIARDVTERKQAEKELLESEEKYRSLVERANDGICIIQEGIIRYINPRLTELWGGSYDEIINTPFTKYLDADSLPKVKDRYVKRMAGKQVQSIYEAVLKDKNANKISVEISGALINYEGKPSNLVIIRDVTEHRKMESSLIKSEEKFRTLFEQSRDPIYITTRAGEFIDCNQAMLNLFGYTREEMIKMDVQKIYIDPIDRKKFQREIEEKGSVMDYEIKFRTKAGTVMDCLLTSSIRLDDTDKIVGYQGIIRDISDRKQAERKLKQSYEELKMSIEGTIDAIAYMAETRDPYTAGHQRRVAKLASAIADNLNLPKEQVEMIRVAGTLHDIGKVGVPAEILSKPGKLTELEIGLIKTHPQIGREILKTLKLPWPICPIVLQHHERINGSGYPKGLKGDRISLEAKIIAVADVVEAMSSHRPYRPTLGLDKALNEISKNRGILYDLEVVDTCLKLFSEKSFSFEQSDSDLIFV